MTGEEITPKKEALEQDLSIALKIIEKELEQVRKQAKVIETKKKRLEKSVEQLKQIKREEK